MTHEEQLLERLTAYRNYMAQMVAEISVLRGALHTIEEWRMPYIGYSFENGSNGERDLMRKVASRALDWKWEGS